MCDQFENEYADAEAARKSEMSLLTALRAMVEEKLKNRSTGARVHGSGEVRGDQEATEWVSHDNTQGYAHDGEEFQHHDGETIQPV